MRGLAKPAPTAGSVPDRSTTSDATRRTAIHKEKRPLKFSRSRSRDGTGSGRVDSTLGDDVGDLRKLLLRKLRHGPPSAFSGLIPKVVEGQRTGARGLADDDPADHARDLVRHAEIV